MRLETPKTNDIEMNRMNGEKKNTRTATKITQMCYMPENSSQHSKNVCNATDSSGEDNANVNVKHSFTLIL